MKLNKKIELGIKAVSVLKTKTTPVRTSDIASEIGTTVSFLEQIMRNLRAAGIVEVKRGPGGGHRLPANSTVTAYDVASAVGKFSKSYDSGDISPENKLKIAIAQAFVGVTI